MVGARGHSLGPTGTAREEAGLSPEKEPESVTVRAYVRVCVCECVGGWGTGKKVKVAGPEKSTYYVPGLVCSPQVCWAGGVCAQVQTVAILDTFPLWMRHISGS